MSDCRRYHPVLSRLAEGEADPAEALEVGVHLRGCTACRILLARERRLAAVLQELLEDEIEVEPDFSRSVMDRLPDGPPPPRDRRGLKIAVGFAVALLGGGWIGRALAAFGLGAPRLRVPAAELAAGDGWPELAGRAVELLLTMAGAIGSRLAPASGWLPERPLATLAVLLPTVAIGMLTASLLAALAAQQALRPRPRSR